MNTRLVAGLILTAGAASIAACGDDGNDAALREAQLQQIAADLRAEAAAATTEPAPEPDGDDGDGGEDGDGAAPEITTPQTTTPSAPTTTVPLTGTVVPVLALDNFFRPEVVEAKVGDEVLWENRGMNDHDVLYVEGDDWGVQVEDFTPGAFYAHVFTEPGEYRYYCSIHGNETVGMVGTVVVSA